MTKLVYNIPNIFQLEESSIFRHAGERKVRVAEDDEMSVADSIATESEVTIETNSDHELDMSDDEDDEDKDTKISGDEENYAEKNDTCIKKEEDINEIESESVKACMCIGAGNTESQDNQGEETSVSVVTNCDVNIEADHERIRTENEVKAETESAKEQQIEEKQMEFPDTEINLQHVQGDK